MMIPDDASFLIFDMVCPVTLTNINTYMFKFFQEMEQESISTEFWYGLHDIYLKGQYAVWSKMFYRFFEKSKE